MSADVCRQMQCKGEQQERHAAGFKKSDRRGLCRPKKRPFIIVPEDAYQAGVTLTGGGEPSQLSPTGHETGSPLSEAGPVGMRQGLFCR